MIHLITGGSASGKSAYAENQVVTGSAAERYYIATMQPWGEEGQARVEKHRRMRREKNFRTIECYTGLENVNLDVEIWDGEKGMVTRAILLECMSNLVANELFEAGGTDEEIIDRIERGICHLKEQAENLIIVTNEVFSDGCSYDSETLRYIGLLGQVNAWLAACSDRVTEVVYGIPVSWRT